MPKFRALLKDELLVQKMISKVREEVKVTPDDLREVKASHILVTTEAEAKALLQRIKKGENFSALAKKYSQDPGSGSRGGDLGYFSTGAMVEPFEKAAFSLKAGEVSGVVKTGFGYHIIKLTDSRLRKFPGAEKDIEKAALAMKQQTAFQKWVSEQRSKARVEIINPELLAHDLRFKGQVFEAIEEYKKAISRNPSNAFLHICLGDTYNLIGKTDLALSSYQSAVDREGGNPDLYIILGKAYEKAGQKEEAIKQYKRASMVAGDDKAKHEELLRLFGEIKSAKGESEERAEIARIAKKEKFEKELKGEK
jgi:tetratricopeptide (TPR) repeat protein